jgi:hypothetical protein
MLTTTDRQILRDRLADMKPEARVRHIAMLRATPGKAAEVAVLEGMHQQLCFAERAASTPLEVVGKCGPAKATYYAQPKNEAPVYWTPERIKYAVSAVSVSAGIVAISAYVIIPALVALASVVVSVVASVAPYVAGGILAVIVLRSAFFGEKKTGNYPAENPARQTGNVYNVYVGEGQVHVHNTGQNPGQ